MVVSYESVRAWGLRFGRQFANTLKRRRPKPGNKWHLDEVFIRIRGKQHYLWRAIDQDASRLRQTGVLEILVQSRRSARAAHRFFRKLLRGLQHVPRPSRLRRTGITDKLRSYAAAKRIILPHVEHRQRKYLNNRIEVSHQPTRRRERQMRRFRSARHPSSSFPPASQGGTFAASAQRFLSTHARIHNHSSSVATNQPLPSTVPLATPRSRSGGM